MSRADIRALALTLLLLCTSKAGADVPIEYHSGSLLHALEWQSGAQEKSWAVRSPNGGGYSYIVPNIGGSWRRYGPGTPTATSNAMESLNLPLLATHPLTGNFIPMLADRWYSDSTSGITYFHIDDDASWSDGVPVTSHDIAFTLNFLSDPAHQTEFQRRQINQDVQAVIIFDPSHFAIVHRQEHIPESIHSLRPLPAHFFDSERPWPSGHDLEPSPVTGPYRPDELNYNAVSFRRIQNWWGDKQAFLKHRFHATDINLHRSTDDAFRAFANGEIDSISSDNRHVLSSPWAKHLTKQYKIKQVSCSGCPATASGVIFSPSVTRQQRQSLMTALENRTAHFIVPDFDLFYPYTQAFEWLRPWAGAYAEPSDMLLRRLNEGRYDAIIISAEMTRDTPEASLKRAISGIDSFGDIAALPDFTYHQYLVWEWVELPEQPLVSAAGLLNPFDAVYGGLFSVNRKARAEMLDKPERRESDTPPAVINYPKKN